MTQQKSKSEESCLIIKRDLTRTEHDDYILNVDPYLHEYNESVPIMWKDKIVAWKIIQRYE